MGHCIPRTRGVLALLEGVWKRPIHKASDTSATLSSIPQGTLYYKRQSVIVEVMAGDGISRRSCVLAWLLSVVLTCLAIYSPHCDRCDGPEVAFLSSPTQASHHRTVPPDTCNGICW